MRRASAREVAAGQCASFLADRLREDLAKVWLRDQSATDPDARPGMAAQVEVLDDLLVTLGSGGLPEPRELRMLLWGYGRHPDYDPSWTNLLRGSGEPGHHEGPAAN